MGVQRLRLNNCSRVEESLGTRLVLTSLNTLSDDDWIPDLSAFQRPDLPSSDDQKTLLESYAFYLLCFEEAHPSFQSL